MLIFCYELFTEQKTKQADALRLFKRRLIFCNDMREGQKEFIFQNLRRGGYRPPAENGINGLRESRAKRSGEHTNAL